MTTCGLWSTTRAPKFALLLVQLLIAKRLLSRFLGHLQGRSRTDTFAVSHSYAWMQAYNCL